MNKPRTRRVADQIRQILAEIVMRELRDPKIGFVTITSVELSPDLQYAKVFISMMGSPEENAVSLEALQKAGPFVRRELGERMRLRRVPELRFLEDLTEMKAGRIEELIHEIRKRRVAEPTEPDRDDQP